MVLNLNIRILDIISLALVLLEVEVRGIQSILPSHAEELYKHAIPDSQGLHWYAVDDEGVVHRVGNSNNGKVHWNGDTSQGRGIPIPPDVKKRIDEMKKDGKVVPSPCKNLGKKKGKK